MPKVSENPRLPAVRRGDFGERRLACFHAAELSPRSATSSRDTTELAVLIGVAVPAN